MAISSVLTVYKPYADVFTEEPVQAAVVLDCIPAGTTQPRAVAVAPVIMRYMPDDFIWVDISTLADPDNKFQTGDKAMTRLTTCNGGVAYVAQNVNDIFGAMNPCC